MIFCLSERSPVSSTNFWIVEKTTPPVFLFPKNSLTAKRDSICTGSCLKKSCALQKVAKSCPSRSFLSVITRIVGLFKALLLTRFPARKVIEKLFPLPCVCQTTPARPSVFTARLQLSNALVIP